MRKNLLVMGDLNSDMLFEGKAEEEKYLGRQLRNILTTYELEKCDQGAYPDFNLFNYN